MLPPKNRLKKKSDFERVFKKGTGYKDDSLILKTLKNNLETSRFGFIVSKKISNKAVVRNKIRRILREIIKKNLPKIKTGLDVVFIANPGCKNKGFWDIEAVAEKLLYKADMI